MFGRGKRRERVLYLCLKIKGQHGKTEVQHEVLWLQAFESTTHAEGHHVLTLNEDDGTDHIKGTNQEDQNEAGLMERETRMWLAIPKQGRFSNGKWKNKGVRRIRLPINSILTDSSCTATSSYRGCHLFYWRETKNLLLMFMMHVRPQKGRASEEHGKGKVNCKS